MKEIILNNNLKLIYKHTESELTSICISLNAGAGVEEEKKGIAHAVEHMVYKKTKNRSEAQINEELSRIFGFQNAMTNYPYVIYYGTLLKEDFEEGINLFSDILLNPVFDEKGFCEEMKVIKEELEEWDEETEQFCEDKLFYNEFNERRIKYPIIGTRDSLSEITLQDLKKFYDKNYFPENASIVVISSARFEEIRDVVEKYFGIWKCDKRKNKDIFKYEISENNKTFINSREGMKNARVQIVFPIHQLNESEMTAFRIFNQYFGEGVNSLLYDTLRTKNSLVYDVLTKVGHENYIKLYKITFTTGKDKVNQAINLVMDLIKNIESKIELFDSEQLDKLIKSYKLKRLFREEQSIVLAKELATYDTMFGDFNIYLREMSNVNEITEKDILNTAKKVFKNLSIQIIK